MKEFLAIISVIFGFATFLPYYRGMWNGTARPHIFSWIPWTVTTGIAFFLSVTNGGGDGSWILGVQTLCCFAVLVYALRNGERRINTIDRITLTGTILVVLFYALTRNAILSVLFVTFIEILGYAPAFKSSYRKPHIEPELAYLFAAIGLIFSIGAIDTYSFVTLFYPLSLIIANFTFVFYVAHRKRLLRK